MQRAKEGGVWGRGEGRGGGGGRGPVQTPSRLSAPPLRAALPPPSPPGAAASTPPVLRLHSAPLLFPSQWKQTALDLAKQENYTEIVTLLLAPPLTATV